MANYRRKSDREKDLTSRYLSGDMDVDRVDARQRFTARSKNRTQERIEKTTLMRAAEEGGTVDVDALPVGQVIQVHSLFSEVVVGETVHLCVVRKTLSKVSATQIVVGDMVKVRATGSLDEQGRPEGVIEAVMPRRTVVTRAESFKQMEQHPIVANADQMLIVASLMYPKVKWGLIDRMIVAAMSGGLKPIVCLNKMDAKNEKGGAKELEFAEAALVHYESMGIGTLRTSVNENVGVEKVRGILKDQVTVLAGHSGVGKSSLINAVQPGLNLKTGEISRFNEKGRHTTTSARTYDLEMGGKVIDTPGVKLFGLWGVTGENLLDYFPDVQQQTAPKWRQESYERILTSLG